MEVFSWTNSIPPSGKDSQEPWNVLISTMTLVIFPPPTTPLLPLHLPMRDGTELAWLSTALTYLTFLDSRSASCINIRLGFTGLEGGKKNNNLQMYHKWSSRKNQITSKVLKAKARHNCTEVVSAIFGLPKIKKNYFQILKICIHEWIASQDIALNIFLNNEQWSECLLHF